MKRKLIVLLLWFVGIAVMFIMSRYTASISVLIYWIILGLLIFTGWLFRLNSRLILLLSFVLFISAGFITSFGKVNFAEIIMRISLLGWLVGLTQSIVEYFSKKNP